MEARELKGNVGKKKLSKKIAKKVQMKLEDSSQFFVFFRFLCLAMFCPKEQLNEIIKGLDEKNDT